MKYLFKNKKLVTFFPQSISIAQTDSNVSAFVLFRYAGTHPIGFMLKWYGLYLLFFFAIFARTMQVLGDFRRKATMTIHCSNLHHWRLGSYHFLFPIRHGRTAGAKFLFITHTHTHPFFIFIFLFIIYFSLQRSCPSSVRNVVLSWAVL